MGNCSLKGVSGDYFAASSIRVLTDTGKILEFRGPTLVREIVNGYPGYGIFRRGHASSPLREDECLINGSYYLLQLEKPQPQPQPQQKSSQSAQALCKAEVNDWGNQLIEPPKISSSDFVANLATGSALEVLPSHKDGVWRVKLVINTKQLEEILSEEVNTEALIEKMRTAATTASLTPRRSRSSWPWVVGWKPALSTVFKAPIENKAP